MNQKRTLNNLIFIKLDKENDSIKLKNGCELYVDTSFEMEKHATVTGEVYGLPSHLSYSGQANKGMPWNTPLEIRRGDKVILYYLSVINALSKSDKKYLLEGDDRYIFTGYQNVYAVIRDGKIIPINGYCLIEPCPDPSIEADKERMRALGMELVVLDRRTNKQVIFGKVKYLGTPNRSYVDDGHSDEGVDISVGDVIIMRKTSDIPLQYSLHAKINDGINYFRVQRRHILAKV